MNQDVTLLKKAPIILGVIAIVTGFLGYLLELDNGLIESLYAVFGFFGGNGSLESIQNSLLLKISAIAAPLSVTVLIIVVFFQNIKKWFFLTFKANNHFVICGLGDMGSALAYDLLFNKKLENESYSKLLIIEPNESNPHIDKMRHQGAIVIIGDATQKDVLQKAKIKSAQTVVCMTGKDIINLEIAVCMAQQKYTTPSLYIHLENRENYELLRNVIFKGMNIKSFSLYDSAAQTLFMKYPIGVNVNTFMPGNKVKIALVGFDKVGESLLYRLLNLGHFYNQEPIEITVFDYDIKVKEQEFLKSYPINIDLCQDYWKIHFEDEHMFYQQSEFSYTQIIFCSTDTQKSFQDAMRMMKTRTSDINTHNIESYLFTDVHHSISHLIDNSDSEFKSLHTFGDFEKLCTYDVIVNESLDEMAQKSNYRYNELHDYNKEGKDRQTQWKELDSFLKDSNRMQVEHLPIKLQILNEFIQRKEKQGEYEELKKEALGKWFKFGGKMIWDNMKYTKEIAEYVPLEVLDTLAKVEKNRWNAFHILNGWVKLDIPKDTTDKIEKNKATKEHPCLLKWDELDSVSINHNHDYKSDDVETVMRIGDMVQDVDVQTSYIKDFIENIKKIENS